MKANFDPNLLRHLVFAAFLESESIIQNADVSLHYDKVHQGYAVSFEGKDTGSFNLVVILNWFYADSEPLEDPIPILVGSHIAHRNFPCDQDRSEISGSRSLVLNVKKRGAKESDLMIPNVQDQIQCTSMLEEGRWLKVLAAGESCYPPFCTGDRTAARITNSSWYA